MAKKFENFPFERKHRMRKERFLRLVKIFNLICKAYPLATTANTLIVKIYGEQDEHSYKKNLRQIQSDLRTLDRYPPEKIPEKTYPLIDLDRSCYVVRATRNAATQTPQGQNI